MAQANPSYCPRCGAVLTQAQQSCPVCGLKLAGLSSPPTRQNAPTSFPGSHAISSTQIEEQQTLPLLPTSAPVMPDSTLVPAQRPRRGRIVFIAILLLLLLLIGTVAYIVTQTLLANTQPAITTTKLDNVVTYAGVTITVLDMQQAQYFADDHATNATQVARLHLRAANQTSVPVNLAYPSLAHLLLPGGKVVAPTFVQGRIGLPAGATQSTIIDFPLATVLPASKLTLRLGTANEVQMDIPLGAHINLSQYAPKTATINQQLQYYGLNYTIVNETSQLSIAGQQASKGMRYAVITLHVGNTLSQTAIPGSPYDYVRLKIGSTSFTPVDSTLPVSFATGETGQSGTVTFLVPQQANSVTFILQSQQATGFNQAVTTFNLA